MESFQVMFTTMLTLVDGALTGTVRLVDDAVGAAEDAAEKAGGLIMDSAVYSALAARIGAVPSGRPSNLIVWLQDAGFRQGTAASASTLSGVVFAAGSSAIIECFSAASPYGYASALKAPAVPKALAAVIRTAIQAVGRASGLDKETLAALIEDLDANTAQVNASLIFGAIAGPATRAISASAKADREMVQAIYAGPAGKPRKGNGKSAAPKGATVATAP